MDLLAKAVIVAIVMAIVIISVYYIIRQPVLPHVTKSQSSSLILDYLKNNYKGAVINITNITPSTYQGSWHILASVIQYATTPCPSYSVLSFDYPEYGFVSRVENNYTGNCVVNGLVQNQSYIVASYPVAIARSHALGIPAVNSFIATAGYENVSVHATYYNFTNFNNVNYSSVWLVNYSSKRLNYSVQVLLTQNGGNPIAVSNVSG